ncbi:alpha-2-glucosyltransferase Alg10 [Syncephalis plumigaleata]|nr:alpha-2-glucosyltransferase Alg10 [Syncephalis plumigaleata]
MTTLTPFALGIVFVVANVLIAQQFNKQVLLPYMDEPFHAPQAQAYCAARFSYWDPKITTPPGLYLSSLLLLWPIRWLNNGASIASDGWCSLSWLRATNILWSTILFCVLYSLSRQLHPRGKPARHAWNAFALSLFPVGYFFNFLYYTDTGSTTLVLLAYLLSLKQRHALAALAAVGSLLFRQTNVIWTTWIMALVIVHRIAIRDVQSPLSHWLLRPANTSSLAESTIRLWQLIVQLSGHLISILPTTLPYLAVLAGFCLFIVINGGIVLGDKSNHEATLHFPQLFYFSCFTGGFTLVHLVWPANRVQRTLKRIIHHPILYAIGVACILYLVHNFTYEHPFILSDNRHFTFYLWKRVYSAHFSVRYLLAPVYALLILHLYLQLARCQTVIWCIGYSVALILTLVPSPLLEFRYFILPFIIYRLHLPLASKRSYAIECLVYIVISLATITLFLTHPFEWPQEPMVQQRFMW